MSMSINIRRKKLIIVLPMLVVGALSLLFSYVYSSMILTIIGLGLVFWASVLYYTVSSYHIPREFIDAYSKSYADTIEHLRTRLGHTSSKAIFFYPKSLKGIMHGYVAFYDSNGSDNVRSLLSLYINDVEDGNGISSIILKGDSKQKYIILKAYSQGIIDLIEGKIEKNLALVDVGELQHILYKVMVEDLMLMDDIIIESSDSTIKVKIIGKDSAALCSSIGDQSLCPLCSSIALAVSKSTGKGVIIEESIIKGKSVNNTLRLIDL
jgi:hypothetical protein